MPFSKLRLLTLAAVLAAVALVPSAGTSAQALPCLKGVTCTDSGAGTTPPPAAPGCAYADLTPALGNAGKIRRATLCLLNKQRTKRHLKRLRTNSELRAAAQRFAVQMVVQRFFDHTSPGGTTFVQRIEKTDYLTKATQWSLGENLGWGQGDLATPRSIVKAWMNSPGHRRNILDRSYREIGIGIAVGTPVGGSGATYVNEFGKRA